MERRNLLVSLAVAVAVLILVLAVFGVFTDGFLGEDQQASAQGSFDVTEFEMMGVSCEGNRLPGISRMTGNSTGEHQTSSMIIGSVPVSNRNATLMRPKVRKLPTHYVINVTSSGAIGNQSGQQCSAKYRMDYAIPHGGTDIYTVTVLHNGQFVMQDYNSRFNNGSIVSGTFG